ncbi:LacI family DNA-binding transcriptional regulator [Vibrio sp.]|uniref:Autoinducer 2-binding periplasmic protein LuxP n=1 Tax=Vibrio viridaestus TaxID=2487322 RepID=A0A3N9TEQ7_9VIBR|nr:LacI family DNA-binding transcriptional regulator [Vibrio viridaestus]MDC0611414.1 LacI family DNA-binding transcriptional regulator [Vibrio sp.]RQW62711.1 LacI family DNA-binding transcriptional regulator [Vibrio viridaestus]
MVNKDNSSTKRSTIADVAELANVSVATVDRVINGRAIVSEKTTKKVLQAAKELNFRATRLIHDSLVNNVRVCVAGVILQGKDKPFYRLLGEELKQANELFQGRCRLEICYLDDLSNSSMCEAITRMASYCHVIGIVSADHPQINDTIKAVSEQGVSVFTLLSEVSSPYVTTHIGVDARKLGRTAGWYIGNLTKSAGPVGLIIGSHRYLCQETYEVGFRTYIREKCHDLNIVDAVVSLENSELAKQATEELLSRYPDIVAIYCAGGGIEGVIEALRFNKLPQKVTVVCNELTEVTAEALRDGTLDIVMSCRRPALSQQFIKAAIDIHNNKDKYTPAAHDIPVEIFCSENCI